MGRIYLTKKYQEPNQISFRTLDLFMFFDSHIILLGHFYGLN